LKGRFAHVKRVASSLIINRTASPRIGHVGGVQQSSIDEELEFDRIRLFHQVVDLEGDSGASMGRGGRVALQRIDERRGRRGSGRRVAGRGRFEDGVDSESEDGCDTEGRDDVMEEGRSRVVAGAVTPSIGRIGRCLVEFDVGGVGRASSGQTASVVGIDAVRDGATPGAALGVGIDLEVVDGVVVEFEFVVVRHACDVGQESA
jgi:hypothetical protein